MKQLLYSIVITAMGMSKSVRQALVQTYFIGLMLIPSMVLAQFSGPSDSDVADKEGGATLVWLGTPSNASASVSSIGVGDTIVLGIKVASYNTAKDSLKYAHIDVQIDKRLYTYLGQDYNTNANGTSQFVGANSKMEFSNNHEHYNIWDQWRNGRYVSDTNYEIHHLQSNHANNILESLDWYVKIKLKVNTYDSSYDYTDGVIFTMGLVSENITNQTASALDPLYAYPYQDFSNVPAILAYTVNYIFHSLFSEEDYSVNTHYESGTNQITKNSNSQTKALGSDGSVVISDQIDTDFSKVQHVVFEEPSSTNLANTAASVVTVADVYLAFQELTDKGINNNQTGNKFTHGIQYVNADIDKDGNFDFDDTFMMLDWLNGGTTFSLTNLSSVMRLIETSAYNSVPSTAIGNYTTTSKYPLGLTSSTLSYTKNITVSWLGDVNLSHSPTPSSNLSVTGMTISNSPSMSGKRMGISNAKEIEMYIENEIKDGKVIARIRTTTGGIPIGAIQLYLKYDKDILSYRDHNFNSGATDFNNVTEDFISFGSLKTEEGAINNLSIYEFTFDTLKPIDSSLGLILFEVVEAVTTDNEQVNILFQ